MIDEATSDDGAIYAFWAFIENRRAEPDPPDYAFRLEQAARLRRAVAIYEGAEDDL